MTTHALPILNWSAIPTGTAGNTYLTPSSALLTNDLYPGLVVGFKDSGTKISIAGRFRVPANYVGTPAVKIVWASSNTTAAADVVWDFDYRAIAATESMDPSAHQESVTVTETDSTTAWVQMVSSVSLTAANLAAGDVVEYLLSRDGADANDDLAATAVVFHAEFQYSDA